MEMSGQLHGLAILFPENELLKCNEYEAAWSTKMVRMFWRREKHLFLSRIEILVNYVTL
jgi:hypothetical protein